MRIVGVLITLFCCCANLCLAQKTIKGTVKDVRGLALESVSINLKDQDGNTVSFTRSNQKGQFTIALKDSRVAGYTLESSSIGYKTIRFKILTAEKDVDLVMEESQTMLENVTIKNRPALLSKGDTLNYRTSDFADKQDRSIGDVLKKMPGIEVAENGKISYNGRSISNFYIDGDNVLDDRYNIGTKSIPQGAVDKVQVIQNDQPIKMLRKNNNSDDVALNLVIKDDATLKVMGDATLGVGAPARYDENLNAMLFNKQYKFINNIRGNNIGNDPGIDLTSHNLSDYLKRLENYKTGVLLSTGAAGVPTLPQSRYLFNNAGMANLNNLYKLKPDLQLKANISYLYDLRKQQYNKYSETYLTQYTVRYTEVQNNKINPQQLRAQFNLNGNADEYYLNNTLLLDFAPSTVTSDFSINNVQAKQSLKQHTLDLSNELNYKKKLNSDHIINFYSYLNRTTQPEQLNVTPGLNADVLNGNESYLGLHQQLELPTWYTNNNLTFAFVKNKFVQNYKLGFNLQQQHLQSELLLRQNNEAMELLSDNSLNDLRWLKSKLYADATYEFSTSKLNASMSVPLSYNRITYNDSKAGLDQQLRKVFLNPSLNLKYQIATETFLTTHYSFKNDLGGIDDVYRGTILKNYRTLYSNDAPILESKTHSVGGGLNFRKAIDMFFFNISGNYSDVELNTISSFTLNDNIQQRIVLPLINHSQNLLINASASKYLFSLQSTVNAGVSYSRNNFQQLQNTELFPFQAASLSYKAGIESKITSFLNLSYKANLSLSTNKVNTGTGIETKYQQLRQQSTIAITTVKNVYLNLSAEHLFTHQANQPNLSYVFADANIRYKVLKIKTDFELGMSNLANIKRFDAIYLSANSFTTGTYQIPGRVVMLKGTFSF
jgi:hypothetical protein